jgi:hypothetical protein
MEGLPRGLIRLNRHWRNSVRRICGTLLKPQHLQKMMSGNQRPTIHSEACGFSVFFLSENFWTKT